MPKTNTITDDQVLALFESRFATAAQVAQVLGILPDSVRRMVRVGKLEPVKIARDNFFRRADVEAYRQGRAPQGRRPKGSAGENKT